MQLYIFADWEGLCTEISDKWQQAFWKSLNLYKYSIYHIPMIPEHW